MADLSDWLALLFCLGLATALALLGLNRAGRAAHRRVTHRQAASEREHQAAQHRLDGSPRTPS